VDNVHEISGDTTPSLASIRSQICDWSNAVILVVTRETRDMFLNYLHKITNDSATDTIQGQGQRPTTGPTRLDEDVEPVFCDNHYSKQSVTSINEFNKSTKDIIEHNFESTMKELDNIQNQFTEYELKKNS